MVGTDDNAEKIITWCCRLLWITVFLLWVFTLGLYSLPITFPYLAAITILAYTGHKAVNDKEAWEEYEVLFLERICGFVNPEQKI